MLTASLVLMPCGVSTPAPGLASVRMGLLTIFPVPGVRRTDDPDQTTTGPPPSSDGFETSGPRTVARVKEMTPDLQEEPDEGWDSEVPLFPLEKGRRPRSPRPLPGQLAKP
jgi:hypothetical protein